MSVNGRAWMVVRRDDNRSSDGDFLGTVTGVDLSYGQAKATTLAHGIRGYLFDADPIIREPRPRWTGDEPPRVGQRVRMTGELAWPLHFDLEEARSAFQAALRGFDAVFGAGDP